MIRLRAMRYAGRSALFVALIALPLGGCFEATRGSIAGGECKVMERPPYVVQGKAVYDQKWIDNEIEGGVAACGWKRPAPRLPELDAHHVIRKVAPKKKPGLAARLKQSIWPEPSTAPLAALSVPVEAKPEIPPDPPKPAPPPKPPKPRSAVDELLDPQPSWRKVYP